MSETGSCEFREECEVAGPHGQGSDAVYEDGSDRTEEAKKRAIAGG